MSNYTEQTGNADTTGTGALSQSADTVDPSLRAGEEEPNPVPEGILHALQPDPAASGEDADKVDYSDYEKKMKDPAQRDMARGYGPGLSPESLAERADQPGESAPEQDGEQEPTDEQGQFDPDQHTVTEVNDYLAGADDEERQRVLDAEQSGQNRKTIVGE